MRQEIKIGLGFYHISPRNKDPESICQSNKFVHSKCYNVPELWDKHGIISNPSPDLSSTSTGWSTFASMATTIQMSRGHWVKYFVIHTRPMIMKCKNLAVDVKASATCVSNRFEWNKSCFPDVCPNLQNKSTNTQYKDSLVSHSQKSQIMWRIT